MLIQKLRLQRGWSQQQLAEASGLSARTIQRIEAGQPASTETLKSLAAVFEIDFATLNAEKPTMNTAVADTEQEERDAFDYVRRLRGFYSHLTRYVVIVGALWVLNLLTSPHHLWAVWVTFGWGIGVLAHATRVFQPRALFGPEWERRTVEKRLGRSL
jgi:transcriptional regulator with XRE-family HTH domain